jgi:hypothetical protein
MITVKRSGLALGEEIMMYGRILKLREILQVGIEKSVFLGQKAEEACNEVNDAPDMDLTGVLELTGDAQL